MKKVLLLTVFALSLCALSSCRTPSQAQSFTLVQEGKPIARIVISANPSSTEKYVASDLQRIIQKISGAQLPIENTIDKSTFNVVIGTPQSIQEIKVAKLLTTNDDETVRIATREKVLFLAGNTPYSALRAVYTFLQEQLDVRWFWPGETGEYLPSQKTISVGNLDITQTPAIRHRWLSIDAPHWDHDTMVWMSRNRMNWHHLQGYQLTNAHIAELHEKGIKAFAGGHNIALPKEMIEKHPEYQAFWGGKRQGDQLAWGNPGVQDAVAKELEGWWEKYPDLDSISFLAPDNTHFSEDELDRALAPDVSTRWQKFCDIVIEKLNKKYPDKAYYTLAYQSYRDVPTYAASFWGIGYATYNINYTKPITDSSNAKARAEIEAWQKVGGKMGIRGYQFIPFNRPMYAPIAPLIIQEIAWAHKAGLVGWESEVHPYGHAYAFGGTPEEQKLPQNQNWITNRMALYAVAQAMWNAETEPAALTKDWANRVFGAAAVPMLDYYTAMQNAWVQSPKSLSYFLQPPASFVNNFISDDLLKKVDADFQQARIAASKIGDANSQKRVIEQIDLETDMLEGWRQVYLLQQGRTDRFKAQAPLATTTPQVTADPDDPAWKNIISLSTFEDSKMQPAPDPTKVLLQWDKDNFYLRFINEGENATDLLINGRTHDSNVFSDDAIEFFLDDPTQAGHYFHIVINAENVTYDAKADPAMNFDKAWNPQITSNVSVGKNSWILDVKLPFREFGITAQEGTTWKMSFKRNGAGKYPNTGWPDASYHNPTGFGTVSFVEKIVQQKRVLMYDAGSTKTDALLAALRSDDFVVNNATQSDTDFSAAFAKGADVISLHYPTNGGFKLSTNIIENDIVPFVKNGGLLIISGYGGKPLDKWFGTDFTVKWDGWKIDPNRKSTFVADGNWQTTPNNLANTLRGGVTPSSGFTPQSDKWEILAKMRMADGSETAYLLRQKLGKGEVILTSSDFGYGGGHEIFGSMNPENIAKLVNNLLVDLRSN